jgi:NAD(P)H-hydrate epimerase
MWLWMRQEAKRIDELTIQSGISAETLMETAGQKSAALIFSLAPLAQTAVILCGPGHNGGDGFVVARELKNLGLKTIVIEAGGEKSSDLRERKKREYLGSLQTVEVFLKNPIEADIWVDGLFGIGLGRYLDPNHQKLLQDLNRRKGFKVALDTPSGLDVDTGNIFGACFKAHRTLTVGNPKPGFYLNEGPEYCGKISSLDIGFPRKISACEAQSTFLLSKALVRRWLPCRKATDNKTKGGKCLILAGSREMPGAALLASKAASRVGAGYIFCSEERVLQFAPEVIPWNKKDLDPFQSILIGPGLGTRSSTSQMLRALQKTATPVIIDADAITVAAKERLYPFPENWIVTPHAGELARILNVSAREIESDRLKFAREAQKILSCTVILKGFHTVIAFPKFCVVIPTGNVALAKAGSGDVLAGFIAGLVSQSVSPERAALLATYLHGQIADDWIRDGKDKLSLSASDLLEQCPRSLRRLRE